MHVLQRKFHYILYTQTYTSTLYNAQYHNTFFKYKIRDKSTGKCAPIVYSSTLSASRWYVKLMPNGTLRNVI